MKFAVLFLFLILTGVGCGFGNFDDYSKLDRLRVIALVPEASEVTAGQSVKVTPIISDIKGAGRALTMSAETCTAKSSASSVTSCEGADDRVVLFENQVVQSLSGTNYTGVDSFASPNWTGALSPIELVIPEKSSIFNGKSTYEQLIGVTFVLSVQIKVSSTEKVNAVKRITVSINPYKNKNPVLNDVLYNGEPLRTFPTSSVKLQSAYASTAREWHRDIPIYGKNSVQEEVLTTWVATDGNFSPYRVFNDDETTYSPPSTKPSNRDVILIGVIHDDRNGIGVRFFKF